MSGGKSPTKSITP